jgi:LuxR family transcriptional regulator, maltose regulon positive regulatory protein
LREGQTPGRYAKLTRPRLARVSPRPRLFRRLDRARAQRVVWVQGPPGSGKTTLLASWLAARRIAAIWLQVDPADGDLAAFFGWLAEAIRALPGGRRVALPAFAPESLAAPGAFARTFFRAVCERGPELLVLDDYHALPAGSPVHAALREGLLELGEGCTLVVASRRDPPPELARLRAAGELEVIGAAELALTSAEARTVARALRPGAAIPGAVLDRVHGWAAGVVLLGAGAPAEGGAPEVFDYLAAEVLADASPEVRDVLLRTAILPELTARTATALSGNPRAPEILTDLARRGYFTVRKDAAEPTFQYHDLFREFLVTRAEAELGGDALRALTAVAARLVEERGDFEAAVELWSRAGAWDDLVRLVHARAVVLAREARVGTLARWIDRLPTELRERNAWLLFWRSVARFPAEAGRAIAGIAEAFERFVAAGDAAGAYTAWTIAADMTIFALHDVAPLDGWIDRLPALRARFPEWPSPEVESLTTAAALAALVHRQPAHPELPRWEERAVALALSPGEHGSRLHLARQLAMWNGYWGSDLGRTRAVMDAVAPLLASPHAVATDVVIFHAADAQRRMYRGEPMDAILAAERGLAVAAERGLDAWDAVLLASRTWGELAVGERARAGQTVATLAKKVPGAPRLAQTLYHQAAGAVAIAEGELRAAVAHGEAALRFASDAGMPLARSDCLVTIGVAAARGGDPAPLHEALRYAREVRSRYAEFGALVGLADHALRSGDEPGALAAAREAFASGRTAEMFFSCWHAPADHAALAALALEAGVETAYATELVRRLRLRPGPRAAGVEAWPWDLRLETLGGCAILRAGAPARDGSAKVARKPLELLRLLVAYGPRGARPDALAEALWPDAEGRAASHALETTLYRLRKLLGDPQAVLQRGGRIALDPSSVFVDAWAVERLLDRVEAAARRCEPPPAGFLERVRRLYGGDLFEDEGEEPAVLSARQRLRERVRRLVSDR